jgi:hypothetical protein
MSDNMAYSGSDPRHHTAKIKQMLNELAERARGDVPKVADPAARALFEATAEVLIGLHKALRRFREKGRGSVGCCGPLKAA